MCPGTVSFIALPMIKVAVTPTTPCKNLPTKIIVKFLNMQRIVAKTAMV